MAARSQSKRVRYIRCPMCLASCELPRTQDRPDATRVCSTCLAKFKVKDAKPAPTPMFLAEGETENIGSIGLTLLMFFVAILTTFICGVLYEKGDSISDDDFFTYFLVFGVFVVIIQWIVHAVWIHSWLVKVVAALVLVSIVLTRLGTTWENGIFKSYNLLFFGLIGVVLIFAEFRTSVGDGGGCSGCGDGCGGGGCGGCGGCGD